MHGEADALVPHEQGEALYQALNKACHDAMFVSMPLAPHGVWQQMLSDPSLGAAATVRSTSAAGCTVRLPEPRAPSWEMVIDFLDASLKRK